MVHITRSRIEIQKIIDSVITPESGGIDVFLGTTRNHTGARRVVSLTYEAYEPMALKLMSRLEEEARARWPLDEVAMVHRLGAVGLCEASVVIAVSSAHRQEAFEACRFLIDRVKQDLPIWKSEHFADGTIERPGTSNEKKRGVEA